MAEPLDTLRRWVETALPELEIVMEARQRQADAPRPRAPYATVQIRQDRPASATPHVVITNRPGLLDRTKVRQIISHLREGTLRVEVFGLGAADLARELELSLVRPDVSQLLAGPETRKSVAVWPRGGILDLTGLRSTKHEPRAQVDFGIRFYRELVVEVPWVETAEPELEAE